MRYMNLLPLFLVISLGACGPNESQKREIAEKKRIECLDKFCEGDIEPPRNLATEVALKLHGQWYIAPKYYYSTGMNGAAFYWPSKKSREDVPQHERAVPYAHTIEIFLTGRQRWPDIKRDQPWTGNDWEVRFGALQAQGLRAERTVVSPTLEIVRFREPSGRPHQYIYYVAAQQRRIRGDGPPVLSCFLTDPPNEDDFCTSGEYWQPDVFADFRLSAKHARDWPAIHQEILRVLSLPKKVHP